ncbi:hypothetical protein ACJQWK_02420 [Exserohilum turcicum]
MGTEAFRISWYLSTAITIPFVAMRVWFRWHRIGKLSIDDYFVLLALACFCAGLVPPQIMWDNGLGGDLSKLTAAQLEAIMKAIVPGTTIYVTTLWCIKFALVFFYRALAAPGSHMVIVYNAALVGLAITYIILFFHIMFHCYPQSRRWNLDPNKRCDQQAEDVNFWLLSLFNIISDLVIICLPITMVSRLQMSLRDKLAVIAMFALGFIVVIASCRTTSTRTSVFHSTETNSTRHTSILCQTRTPSAYCYRIRNRSLRRPHYRLSPSRAVAAARQRREKLQFR